MESDGLEGCGHQDIFPYWEEKGYYVFRMLSDQDLSFLQKLVSNRVSSVLQKDLTWDCLVHAPADQVAIVAAEKALRLFSSSEAELIFQLASIKRLFGLGNGFAPARATDPLIGIVDTPEVYFRIVPPSCGGDPALGHIDWWYDDIYAVSILDRPTVKVWISLQTEPGKNGLLVKHVDTKTLRHKVVQTEWGPKPRLQDPPDSTFYDFPLVSNGDAIVFKSDEVLHMGSMNRGDLNRISMEISLVPVIYENQ